MHTGRKLPITFTMSAKKDDDFGYFREDKTVTLGDEPPRRPLLLTAKIVGPLLAMTGLVVFSVIFLNTVKMP